MLDTLQQFFVTKRANWARVKIMIFLIYNLLSFVQDWMLSSAFLLRE